MQKRVFRGVGQWSPAVYLNQLVVFIIGFDILRVSTIKMHCNIWPACKGFSVLNANPRVV